MDGIRQRWSALPAAARWGIGMTSVFLVLVLVLSLLSGASSDNSHSGDGDGNVSKAAPPVGTTEPSEDATASGSPLDAPPATPSANTYAASIARIVLGTKPRDHDRDDYIALLLGEVSAEAVGESRERIEPVIESAIPDDYQWLRQRDFGQVNAFRVEHVWEPDAVDEVREDIPDGYDVRTVAGTQKTLFIDENGDRARSSTPRLLTVFAYCPDSGSCSLVSIPQEVIR